MRVNRDMELDYKHKDVEKREELRRKISDLTEQKEKAQDECKEIGREISQCERYINELSSKGSLKSRWEYHVEHGSLEGYTPTLVPSDEVEIERQNKLIAAHKETIKQYATVIHQADTLIENLNEELRFSNLFVKNQYCSTTVIDDPDDRWFGESVVMFTFMLVTVGNEVEIQDVTIYRKAHKDKTTGKVQLHHQFFIGESTPSKPMTNNKELTYILRKYLNDIDYFTEGT